LNWLKLSIIVLFTGIIYSCQQSYRIAPHDKSLEGVEKGQYIPYFKAIDTTGEFINIEKAMGKATIIDFWASWCRPCRETANPAYRKLYRKYHLKGLNVIGVSSDRRQYFWKKAIKEDVLPWKQVLDSTQRILKLYQVKRLPTMYLIDSHGKVIGRNLWGNVLEHTIDSLLNL